MMMYLMVRPSKMIAMIEPLLIPDKTPKAITGCKMSGSDEKKIIPTIPYPSITLIIFSHAGELKSVGKRSGSMSTPCKRRRASKTALPTAAPMALAKAVKAHRSGRARTAAKKITTVAAVKTRVNILIAVPNAATQGNHVRAANCSNPTAIRITTPVGCEVGGLTSVVASETDDGARNARKTAIGTANSIAASPIAKLRGRSPLASITCTGQALAFLQGIQTPPVVKHCLHFLSAHNVCLLLKCSCCTRCGVASSS
mmetsp:Transcript_27352/g.45608  ORF Transcript_27352/g.45608 Transcript_27352/m.45608 type:complete len:256 (-) Transcript_27352:231-998(-)